MKMILITILLLISTSFSTISQIVGHLRIGYLIESYEMDMPSFWLTVGNYESTIYCDYSCTSHIDTILNLSNLDNFSLYFAIGAYAFEDSKNINLSTLCTEGEWMDDARIPNHRGHTEYTIHLTYLPRYILQNTSNSIACGNNYVNLSVYDELGCYETKPIIEYKEKDKSNWNTLRIFNYNYDNGNFGFNYNSVKNSCSRNKEIQFRVVHPNGDRSDPIGNIMFLSDLENDLELEIPERNCDTDDVFVNLNAPGYVGKEFWCTFESDNYYKTVITRANSSTLKLQPEELPTGEEITLKVILNDGTESSICPFETTFNIVNVPTLSLTQTPRVITTIEGTPYHTKVNGGTGTVTLNASGGKSGCTYYYSVDGSTPFELTNGDEIDVENGDVITLSNSDGCTTVTSTVEFNEPDPLEIINLTSTKPTCHTNNNGTNNNGTIEFSPSGGISPYTIILQKKDDNYNWQPTNYTLTNNSYSGLAQGKYRIKLRDKYYTDTEYEVESEEINLIPDEIPVLDFYDANITCKGGTTLLTSQSGWIDYTLKIKKSDESSYTDFNSIQEYTTGTYSMRASNSDGCYVEQNNIAINEPQNILSISTSSITNKICDNKGSVTYSVSGGWANNYPYYIEVLDSDNNPVVNKNTTISSGALTNKSFTNLDNGDYTLKVYSNYSSKNNYDCEASTPFSITYSNPLELSVTGITQPNCANNKDGQLILEATGTDNSATYTNLSPSDLKVNLNTFTSSPLLAGTHNFSVTDSRGCIASTSYILTNRADPVSLPSDPSDRRNATCSTAKNGSFKIEAINGVSGYTYTLSNGDSNTTGSFDSLYANNYTLTVIDNAGCKAETEIVVEANENPVSLALVDSDNKYCDEGDKGWIELRGGYTGDAGPLTYINGNASETADLGQNKVYSNLNEGTYTIRLQDEDECYAEVEKTIENYSIQSTYNLTDITELACSSATNGAFTINAINGANTSQSGFVIFDLYDSYSDLVEPIATINNTKSYHRLSDQIYTLNLTDLHGCQDSYEITPAQSANAISLNPIDTTHTTCSVAFNGTIQTSASLGVSFYNNTYDYFLYKGEDTLQSIRGQGIEFTGLEIGDDYQIIAIDSVGCQTSSDVFSIESRPNTLDLGYLNTINLKCNSVSTGQITPALHNTLDDLIYNYELIQGIDTIKATLDINDPRIKNLAAGDYALQVFSSDGCSSSIVYQQITQPDTIQIFDEWNNYIRAKGASTGEYRLHAIEGNKVYEYQWLDSASNDILEEGEISYSEANAEYEAILNIQNQPAGIYTLKLRDTAQCAYFNNDEWYTQQVHLIEPEDTLGFESITLNHITCNKFSDGSIELLAKGGWGNTTDYRYSLDTTAQVSWYRDNTLFDQLTAGFYNLFLKDTADIVYQTMVELTQPDTLNILVEDQFNASCPNYADGWVKAAVLKDADYTNKLFYSIVNTNNSGDTITTNTLNDTAYFYNLLSRGAYQISVQDTNQCYASKEFSIGEPDTALISLDYNYIRRKGDATGMINALVENGNGQFDYAWYHENETEAFDSGKTDAITGVDNLIAGNYLLMLRDTAGCVYEEDEWMRRSIAIVEPDAPLLTDTVQLVSPFCNGLSNGFIQLQATGGWGDYTYTMNNESNHDGLFQNLAAGTYSLIIRDSVDVEYLQDLVITEPEILTASLRNYKDVRCFDYSDGYINLNIEGGNLMYEVSVDENTWFANDSVPNLPVGTYTVYVRDTLNCKTNVQDITLTQPTELIQTEKKITLSRCSNNEGSIISDYTGGIEPYTYSWLKDTLLTGNIIDTVYLDYITPSIDNLYSSRYFLTINDGHNCPYKFEFLVGDITDLSIDTVLVTDVSCYGYSDGEATAIVSKGNRNYIYSWASSITQTNDSIALGIPTGNYDLLVRDAKGCASFKEFTVGTPDSLAYSINTLIDPLCLGGVKGEIDLAAIGGTAPYQYLWDNGSTSTTINGIDPGSLNLQVTDSHNCVNNFRFNFGYQRTVQPFIGNDTLICHYNTLPVNAGNYAKYQWTSDNKFSSTKQNVMLTEPDNYYLQVTDNDNCIGFDTLQLDVSYLTIASINTVDVTCNGMADASAVIDVTPANWAHTIEWPDLSNQNQWQNLSGGNYAVRVFDNYGCGDTVNFSIYEPDPLRITNNLVMNPYCFGVADGKIEVSTSGGRLPHTLNWLHGSQANKIAKLDTGRYVLEVHDLMNCFETEEYILGYEKTIYPQLGEDQIICEGNNVRLYPGFFDQYNWSANNGITSNDTSLVISKDGTYYVEVKNDESCIGRDTVNIETTNSALTPEFLMASSVPAGDTLIIIEVSQPKPSYFNWAFSGPHQIIEQDNYYCKVIFEEEGNWEVALNAYVGECLGQNIKHILVTPAVDHSDTNSTEQNNSTISSLTIAPNPTDGPFNATLKLAEVADAIFYLVNIDTGQIIEKRKVNGIDSYNQSFSLTVPGMYAVFAEAKGERVVSKLVVY
nr:SprB repeat-containing protein [uncultured Carboxylicivirga sp.]